MARGAVKWFNPTKGYISQRDVEDKSLPTYPTPTAVTPPSNAIFAAAILCR